MQFVQAPGQKNHVIVSDELVESMNSMQKEATPFQKFQESLKG